MLAYIKLERLDTLYGGSAVPALRLSESEYDPPDWISAMHSSTGVKGAQKCRCGWTWALREVGFALPGSCEKGEMLIAFTIVAPKFILVVIISSSHNWMTSGRARAKTRRRHETEHGKLSCFTFNSGCGVTIHALKQPPWPHGLL